MMKTSTRIKKAVSVYVALSLLTNSIFPTYTKAITGPSAPEFSSFEPVSSNGMVSEFSGDFSYNLPILSIPGADGGGYALSLSYKNTSPEDDASWVGFGWTLSPGAIIRSKNGFPDDINGEIVKSFNEIPTNWTTGLGMNAGLTIEGFSLSASIGELLLLQYNNHQGYSYTAIPNIGVGIGYGVLSLNLSLQDGEGSFSAQVNPANAMQFFQKKEEEVQQSLKDKTLLKPHFSASRQLQKALQTAAGSVNKYSNSFISYTCDNSSRNTSISEFTAHSYKMQVGVYGTVVGIPVGGGADLFGTHTFQESVPSKQHPYFGYLYSANATDANALMDYYTEKDQGFNKRDYYSSIPYARPDQFLLMGEGLSGGFRAFSKKVGHFKTNEVESRTELFQIGVDIQAGPDVGLGGSFQTGEHSIKAGDWDDEGVNDDYNFSNGGDESFYMSFMMDPAQQMSFGGDATDLQAHAFFLEKTNGNQGSKSYRPQNPPGLPNSINVETDNNSRIPRSSQVIYHTNRQMTEDEDNDGNLYNRYSPANADYETYLNRDNKKDQIGEFVVYNNAGNRYVYGLPVYSQEEWSLAYDISNPSTNYIVKENITEGHYEKKVGDYIAKPYATSWLLTNIVSPNYIDRTMDGPTPDDFGGWTKFNYSKKYGYHNDEGNNDWYKWRVPYNGLYNNPGSLSDDTDDMGSFSSGEKEMYYVKSIETKTHIARFYKSQRNDGYDAADDEAAANPDSWELPERGNHSIDKLDSIYLYAKNDNGNAGEVIKRIYFDYNYSLMKGQPNSSNNMGKLTLKKVWFEYGDVRNAQISPYEFSYKYPANNPYPAKYNNLNNYGGFLDADAAENPDYDKCNVDRWGNYQYQGANRLNSLNPWLDQTPSANFDPAAWQLKSIKLPTGGQIDVQYEADDYLYVQDRRAMNMVSISSIADDIDGKVGTPGDKFYLNLNKLGITSVVDKAELVSLMRKQFIDGEAGKGPQKIYFKFLYSLHAPAVAGLGLCGSDYITGYVNVDEVGSDAMGVYLKVGPSTAGAEDYSFPRQVCIDFYDKTRVGNINSRDGCPEQAMDENDDPEAAIYDLLGIVEKVDDLLLETHDELCLDIDENNSYLRIPALKSKKGGGLRVKRILMFDAGLEANDATLNGKEYVYQNTDGLSSGVATNEPSQGREENALVTYLDVRKDSEWYQKVISGEDLEQYEGPIGEGILPGASVGYSRVVAKNIHTDENTNDGFSISEFNTVKDYPFDGTYSYIDPLGNDPHGNGGTYNGIEFEPEGIVANNEVRFSGVDYTVMDQEDDLLSLPAVLFNKFVSNIWSSQGYRFIVNDMNGKPKSNAVYSGNYANINTPNLVTQVSGMEYTYFKPLEPVPVIDRWEWKDGAEMGPGHLKYRVLGKQMDVVTESRAIKDHLNDLTLELDGSIGIWPLFVIPWITGMAYGNETVNELYTHVTTKVIYAATQLKSIRKYQDGIYVNTHNEFFDVNTGEAMVNITNDGFNELELDGTGTEHDGKYVNYSFPAAHYYDGVGVRSITDGYHVENPECFYKMCDGDNISIGYDVEHCGSTCAMNIFTPGDLIALTHLNEKVELYNVGEVIGNTATLLANGDYYHDADADGCNIPLADVSIVNTARKNQLGAKAGALTTYGRYPNVTNVPIPQSVLDARDKVANAINVALNNPNFNSGTITVSLNFPEVSVIDEQGNCVPLDASETAIISQHTEEISYYTYQHNRWWYNQEVECDYPFACPYQWYVEMDPEIYTEGGIIIKPNNPIFYYDSPAEFVDYNFDCINQLKDISCENHPISCDEAPALLGCSCATCYVRIEGITIDSTLIRTYSPPMLDLVFDGCTFTVPYVEDYRFYVSRENGELMYGNPNNTCDAVLVGCFDFCPNEFPSVELDKVVASSAAWLSDEWELNTELKEVYDLPGTDLNDYEYGAKGHWLGKYSYDYNTVLSDIEGAKGRAWNSGIYSDFTVFNWDYEEANDSIWTLLNTTTRVSPNCMPLAEMNALDIYSSIKMGYNFSVPYLTASNSTYPNVLFESFETATNDGTNIQCEDGYQISLSNYASTLVSDIAHTGNQSLSMGFVENTPQQQLGLAIIYESELELQKITLNNQTINEGVSIKLWIKSEKLLSEMSLQYQKYDALTTTGALMDAKVNFIKIAQVGEWILYEAKITDFGAQITDVASSVTPTVFMKVSQGFQFIPTPPTVYIDDLRMQPIDAQVMAYVYDPATLRLLASFDDQHFPLLYQYNDEGKLVRKMKETAEGVKTISETQYNIPKSDRP